MAVPPGIAPELSKELQEMLLDSEFDEVRRGFIGIDTDRQLADHLDGCARLDVCRTFWDVSIQFHSTPTAASRLWMACTLKFRTRTNVLESTSNDFGSSCFCISSVLSANIIYVRALKRAFLVQHS